MNQNMLPTSRRKLRPRAPIPCTTTTGIAGRVWLSARVFAMVTASCPISRCGKEENAKYDSLQLSRSTSPGRFKHGAKAFDIEEAESLNFTACNRERPHS